MSGKREYYPPNSPVEVRSRFDQRWVRGFEVAEPVDEPTLHGYRIRRRSDGSVLPVVFSADDVRDDPRTSNTMWWI